MQVVSYSSLFSFSLPLRLGPDRIRFVSVRIIGIWWIRTARRFSFKATRTWSLISGLTREEEEQYLENRRQKVSTLFL